ncbi:MAG: tRNA (cytidine(34)-2'-O)-methyltransferase [Thermoguttaceae bacterium]|jgi:tRNA (cytidine/uridine-2'-O-)-methyltransferase
MPHHPDASTQPLLHLVLYQPEIPQNAGAVARTCVALGAKLWLVRPLRFQLDSKHMRRAGLDYWEHLDWEVVDDWQQLRERIGSRGFWYFSKGAGRLYTEARYAPGDALVFGGESAGLPASLIENNREHCLRIPIRTPPRSLNLSVSAAVVAFEARRQFVAAGLLAAEPCDP